MPSKLKNLKYKVQWSDFAGKVPADAALNAEIHSGMSFSGMSVAKTADGGVTLADTLELTITLDRSASWARSGAARTAELLKHEQGHYDITALTARDLFIDLMQLKAKSFADAAALQQAIDAVRARYDAQKIQDVYDESGETDHGRNSDGQKRWDGYLSRAFNEARQPEVTAPDGVAYKIPLRDVLTAAGKKI